jgi:hypothetical protein
MIQSAGRIAAARGAAPEPAPKLAPARRGAPKAARRKRAPGAVAVLERDPQKKTQRGIGMGTRMASDEVTDGIAAIEMHRQGTEKESGLAAACSEALRKLHELLEQERAALQQHGPETVFAINVEAVENEIRRVQAMAGIKGRGPMHKNARPSERQAPRQDKPHNAPRNRGRRSMGRTGGRSGGGSGGPGGR